MEEGRPPTKSWRSCPRNFCTTFAARKGVELPHFFGAEFPWVSYTGWWFQTFFIFHHVWDNPSHWLIFFRGVETTNQYKLFHDLKFCEILEKPCSQFLGFSWQTGRLKISGAAKSSLLQSVKAWGVPFDTEWLVATYPTDYNESMKLACKQGPAGASFRWLLLYLCVPVSK